MVIPGLSALDRKLLRDFRRLWAQALAIALVLACGVASVLIFFGMYRALEETQAAYYDRNRFADVFASARRAPATLLPEVAAIPGALAAETRITGSTLLDIPGRTAAAVGHVLSLPPAGEPRLNLPLLVSGRLPGPDAADEIAVNAPFAEANRLRPGDRIAANLNGKKRELTITGTLRSPEFIYTLGPAALMPDNAGFGVVWMPERAAAAAFGMEGAFNDLSLSLLPGARAEPVIAALDTLLEPYGGIGAHDRSLQQSHAFVDSEIAQLRGMALILPPIFFGISAFLVNMVIGRIIALERAEIGLLKAVGYRNSEVAAHYLMLGGLTALAGTVIGWAVGGWLARGMAGIYALYFDFPFLIFRISPSAYAISGLLGLAAATGGAARSALAAARLAPAIAMQPPAPPRYSQTLLDRALTRLRISQPTMMILRSVARWPVRAGMTALGLSMGVAVLVAAGFTQAAVDEILDSGFARANRQDVTLIFAEDLPETAALAAVSRLPGVLMAEGQAQAPVTLRNGHLEKQVAIEARRPGADLARVLDGMGGEIAIPPQGLILSERLARQLALSPSDTVEVAFLTGRRETVRLPLTATAETFLGLGAWMDLDAFAALTRQRPVVSAVHVALDPGRVAEFDAATKDLPAVASTVRMTDIRRSFQQTIAENMAMTNAIYYTIAVLITAGVTYNGARIQLSERARELASLRILGFGRAEVSWILVGECFLLALLAQPIGWLVGVLIIGALVEGTASDLYAIPYVLPPANFAQASLVALAAALAAALVVRRRIDRFDLVAVMKTRE